MDLVETPNPACLSNVTGFGGVDAGQDADPFAMLRILAHRNVHSILVEDRCRIDFAGAFGGGVFELLALRWIAIVLPNRPQERRIAFFNRLRVERVAKPVATAE